MYEIYCTQVVKFNFLIALNKVNTIDFSIVFPVSNNKETYHNIKKEDPFLQALVDGGFQVEELAKLHYPDGILIEDKKSDGAYDYKVKVEETNVLLERENVIIFEAAFQFENLFIRVDILEKKGIMVVPDILANAGGVSVSYFEWVQNLQQFKWPEKEINEKLEQKMVNAFNEVYSISKLMEPISKNYGEITETIFKKTPPKAVLLSSHLKRHRLKLYINCSMSIGCDLYGKKYIPITTQKKELLSQYQINLCPENFIGQGYITGKIPEAFLSGCIPVTYCDPNDLKLDFNHKAVVNLYGLSGYQIRKKLKRNLVFNNVWKM